MSNKHKHLAGSHKDSLLGNQFQPYHLPQSFWANGNRFLLPGTGGYLLEKDTAIDGIQPFGYVRPQFFRSFSDEENPHVDDVKSNEKAVFGKKCSHYDFDKSTIGLELEFMTYDRSIVESTLPELKDKGYIHPMYEFFQQLGEIGTHAELGGIFSNPVEGLQIHYSVNQYLSSQSRENEVFFCPLGTIPIGNIRGSDVSIHNEYLRRISMRLSQRRNEKLTGISDDKLKKLIKSFQKQDFNQESTLHDYTSQYGVLTFQPMISVPNYDGDLLIQIANFINGPILLALSALFHSSPFWKGEYSGYQGYRFELRHIFKTGLQCPYIPLWNDGTRSRVIKHLTSGEGINLGRAIVSDENTCYSNSLFRIRPDISAIEIASFDSHPIPELRVAVSMLLKILFHYVNYHLIHYGSDYLRQQPHAGVLGHKDYYKSYTSVAKNGLNGTIHTKNGDSTTPRHIINNLLSTMRSYSHQQNFMNDSDFCRYISNPIVGAHGEQTLSSFEEYFLRSQDGLCYGSLSELLIKMYHDGQTIEKIIHNYVKKFQTFYS